MRFITIIIYIISIYTLKTNNLEDVLEGELEKIIEVIKTGLFTVSASHPRPLKNHLNKKCIKVQ